MKLEQLEALLISVRKAASQLRSSERVQVRHIYCHAVIFLRRLYPVVVSVGLTGGLPGHRYHYVKAIGCLTCCSHDVRELLFSVSPVVAKYILQLSDVVVYRMKVHGYTLQNVRNRFQSCAVLRYDVQADNER